MSERLRIPRSLWAKLDAAINAAEEKLRKQYKEELKKAREEGEDEPKSGHTNADIAALVLEPAMEMFADFVKETVADVVSRRISVVLGGAMDPSLERAEQAFLPNLELPSHFSVPQPDGSAARWKRKDECTPNDLLAILEHRRIIEAGWVGVTNKIEIMRETAIRLGCDLNAPISSVMNKDDRRGRGRRRSRSEPNQPRL